MKHFTLLLILFTISFRCVSQTETPSIQIVKAAAENAINLVSFQLVPHDTLGLFLPMSDSAYCSLIQGVFYYRYESFIDSTYSIRNINSLKNKIWDYKGNELHAFYSGEELVSIAYGSLIPLAGVGSSMSYHFYLGKLIFTQNNCTAYIGAMCSGEACSVSYIWRDHAIISYTSSAEETESLARRNFFDRCYCARLISQTQWLDELRSILHYMQHVKPEKNK